MLRDLLENFCKAFNQRSRAAFSVSVLLEFQPGTTDTASEIATRHGYEHLVSAGVGSSRDVGVPVSDGAESFLTRVICKFLDRRKPDVCHEAAAEMGLGD